MPPAALPPLMGCRLQRFGRRLPTGLRVWELVVALRGPWENPLYTRRVWCVFCVMRRR